MESRGWSWSPLWLTAVFIVLLREQARSFNVETDYFVMHRRSGRSMFGFSLALHKDASGSWVLVGAPKAESMQPGITEGGAVYRCHAAVPDDCEAIPFDVTGNHFEAGRQVDDKSHQWFGASVTSRGGVIVACAPRYTWFSVKRNRQEPVGKCFISDERTGSSYELYSPCMTSAWGFHRQGSCQAGYGLALTKSGNHLYVGAVGSWYWQGQVFYQNLLDKAKANSTPAGPQSDDSSYLGYSVGVGEFTGDEVEDVVVGMPRGHNLTGQLVILDHALKPFYNITGDQIGSYFGYSVAVLDVDGDGMSDIVGGAPWYTPDTAANHEIELGIVAVYTQTPQHNFKLKARLEGRTSRAHFGLSVTTLKDLDLDGYEDFAVGAPHDGVTGRGAVYIYMGSASGPSLEPAQVLMAEELTQVRVSYFGWSVAGGIDLDGNDYPDLAIGAFESNHVAVFRTRPVVKVTASIHFTAEGGAIDLDERGCSLQDGKEVACVPLSYCFQYKGIGVPKKLDMGVGLSLDAKSEGAPRMFFLKHEGRMSINMTKTFQKGTKSCSTLYAYVLPNPRDRLTPLEARLTHWLGSSPPGEKTSLFTRDGSHWANERTYVDPGELRPILSPKDSPTDVKDSIIFWNNCGDDNNCIPDLKLRVDMRSKEYVMGSTEDLPLEVALRNEGEDAFGAGMEVRLPRGVRLGKITVASNTAESVTPLCSLVKAPPPSLTPKTKDFDVNNEEEEEEEGEEMEVIIPPAPEQDKVRCEVGNPLPANSTLALKMILQPVPDEIDDPSLAFYISALSSNKEAKATEWDNGLLIGIPVVAKTVIKINGISWPEEPFYYNASHYGMGLIGKEAEMTHEDQVGPSVTHVYDVSNTGPSDIIRAQVFLLWPSSTLSGNPLLYLLEAPHVTERGTCHEVPQINPLGLKIEEVSFGNNLLLSPEPEAEVATSTITSAQPLEYLKEEEEEVRMIRLRREAVGNSPLAMAHRTEIADRLSCGPTLCTRIVCRVGPLRAGENVVFRVRSRLWIDTLEELEETEVRISSKLVVDVQETALGVSEAGSEGATVFEKAVTTVVITGSAEPSSALRLIVIISSIFGGLMLLAVLSIILWSLGFFKRKRPTEGAEREPLNENGYYNNS